MSYDPGYDEHDIEYYRQSQTKTTSKLTTSKIKSVEFKKKLNFGNVYLVTMESGDTGEAIEKDEPSIGESWTYDLEETQYGNKIRRVKEQGKFAGKPGGFSKEPFEEKAVASAYNQTAVLFSHKAVEEGKSFTLAQYIKSANEVYDAMLATAKRGRV